MKFLFLITSASVYSITTASLGGKEGTLLSLLGPGPNSEKVLSDNSTNNPTALATGGQNDSNSTRPLIDLGAIQTTSTQNAAKSNGSYGELLSLFGGNTQANSESSIVNINNVVSNNAGSKGEPKALLSLGGV